MLITRREEGGKRSLLIAAEAESGSIFESSSGWPAAEVRARVVLGFCDAPPVDVMLSDDVARSPRRLNDVFRAREFRGVAHCGAAGPFSFLQSAARWRLSAYGANPQFATFFCRGRFSKMSGLTLGKVGRVKLTPSCHPHIAKSKVLSHLALALGPSAITLTQSVKAKSRCN